MAQESGSSMMLAPNLRLRGEDNYQQWRYNMENIARVHGLRKYYHPNAPAPPKCVDEFDENVSEKDIKAFDDWARGDSKMKLIITNNVSASIAGQVDRLSTAKEMWEVLANQYESSGVVLNQQAISQYIKMDYADHNGMDAFIIAFQKSIDTLNLLKIAPPDSWHPLVFLEAVKDSFPIWAERQRANCRGRDKVTLNELIHDLKDESRADQKTRGNQMAVFGNNHRESNKPKSGNPEKPKNRSRPIDCKVCGNPRARHAKGKCFEDPTNKELRREWELKKNKKWLNFSDFKKLENHKEITNQNESNDIDTPRFGGLPCINLSGLSVKNSDRWIPDTGATTHISNSLDKFETFEEISGLPLIATASGPVRPRGAGNVILQCRLSNGKNNPFELKNVLYLPECPVNLFSGHKLLNAGGYLKDGIMYGPDGVEFATYDHSLYINE